MADLHLADFFADAAKTVVTLHRVFPRPIALYVEDISGPDQPDEYGVHGARHQACFATILWLAEEGYLRYGETIRQDAVDQAVLTGRCFAALHGEAADDTPDAAETGAGADDAGQPLPPSVHRQRATVIYQLEDAVASKSSAAIEAAFLPLLQQFSG